MSGQRLLNKVAIVTGSSQGIGREVAKQFHLEGAQLVCADLQPLGKDGDVATHDLIAKEGGKAIYVKADVSIAAEVENLVAATVAEYGRVDIIVNNAGIFPELVSAPRSIDDADEVNFAETLRVNTSSAFLGSKYAVKQFKKQEKIGGGLHGAIVNIASTAALVGNAGLPGYSASKGAIVALTRSTAMDVSKAGIICNCIAPGFTETRGLEACFDGFLKGATPELLAPSIPMQRIGKPKDIARAAVYLASEDASWVTGTTLTVDGGSVVL